MNRTPQQQASAARSWLHVSIDDWSFVLPESQLRALREGGDLKDSAEDGALYRLAPDGWPVFDIDMDLNLQPSRPRRFTLFLHNLLVPVGIGADRVDILMPESVRRQSPVPGLLREDRFVTGMLVLNDGRVAAQLDGVLLALHLSKALPADFVAEDAGAAS